MPGGNDTAFPDDFTLGLSKFVEPDLTSDVVDCSTTLYSKHGSSLLMVPTQEKPTVMASQLQRQMVEADHEEEQPSPLFPPEETGLMSRNDLDASKAEAAEDIEKPFDIPTTVRDDEAKSEEVETQEEAEVEEPVVGLQSEEGEEEAQATSWSEEVPASGSQTEEVGSKIESERESEEDESPEDPSPDSQAEDEHETPGEDDPEEHVTQQAHRRSEGGVVPVGEAGDSEKGKEGHDMSGLMFPDVPM